ncbi:MAG: flagellar motor switch protein FliN [Dehalococcoidia bacterium]|nr:MAG: flagellar motor switch protein FliN [Dehalococcoidia bacterium]
MADGISDDIDALFDATPPGVSVRVARALSAVSAQARDLLGAGLESVTGRPVQVADVAIKAATYSEVETEFASLPHMGFEVRVAFSPSESHLLGALVQLPDLGTLLAIETGEAALADADFARAQTATVGTSVRELLDFISITLFAGALAGLEVTLSDLRIGQIEYTMGIVSDVARNAPSVRVDLSLMADGKYAGVITLVVPEPFLDRLADAAAPEDEVEPVEPTPLRRGPSSARPGSGPSAGNDDVDVHPVRFPPLPEIRGMPAGGVPRSLDLIMDVSMRVTVELGRSSMTVEDVLSLGPGSVVELNKLAGEPVDVLVNEQLIARGEVVVVDENFGVRVTEIVSPRRRAHAIGGM